MPAKKPYVRFDPYRTKSRFMKVRLDFVVQRREPHDEGLPEPLREDEAKRAIGQALADRISQLLGEQIMVRDAVYTFEMLSEREP